MKKYLIISTALASLFAGSNASAGWMGKGMYFTLSGGMSSITGKVPNGEMMTHKDIDLGAMKDDTKRGNGALIMAVLGHKATFGKGLFAGEFAMSYDSGKAQIGTVNPTVNIDLPPLLAGKAYKIYYKPKFGLGVAAKAGMYFTPTIIGYVRLGLDYNFSKIELATENKPHTYSLKVWSFVPGAGLEGMINEKTSWLLGIDYKVAFSISHENKKFKFKNKPNTFIARAGVTYHF